MSLRPKNSQTLPSALALTLFSVALLTGCGGGGTGSSGGGTQSTGTPDNGQVASVSDAYGFTLTNASSGMVLGIAGQSQVAGTALAQETSAGSATTDDMWHAMPMGTNQLQYNEETMKPLSVQGPEGVVLVANPMTASAPVEGS